jgi:hypothetical protein
LPAAVIWTTFLTRMTLQLLSGETVLRSNSQYKFSIDESKINKDLVNVTRLPEIEKDVLTQTIPSNSPKVTCG